MSVARLDCVASHAIVEFLIIKAAGLDLRPHSDRMDHKSPRITELGRCALLGQSIIVPLLKPFHSANISLAICFV